MVLESSEFIGRSERDLDDEAPLVEPYWDPALGPAHPENRVRLFDVHRTWSRLVWCQAGVNKGSGWFFFVTKKDGLLRLIVDARQPNQLHRLPRAPR